jgi:hypothetical protein
MTEPQPLFADKQPGPREEHVGPVFVETARAIAAICAVRMLLLITVITGAVIWSFTVWDPQQPRLYAAVAFSVAFLLPLVLLYWKRA